MNYKDILHNIRTECSGCIDFIREAFSESNLPFRVDIIEWAGISGSFKEIIKKNYVVLKKRN